MRIAIWIISIILLLAPIPAPAFELTNLSLVYQRFDPSNRIPDLSGFIAKEGLNLEIDTNLFWRVYWGSRVVSFTDDGGYKLVGLNMHIGVRVLPSLSIEYEHFSKHMLDHTDANYPAGKFPVQDSLNVVWRLY